MQILGIVMTAVGAAGSTQYTALVGSTLPTGVVVLGVFIMLISLVGCVGAKRENKNILAAYAIILLILILCQVIVGLVVYANSDQATSALTAGWDITTNDAKVLIQNQLGCCGLSVYNASAPLLVSGLAGQPCPDPIANPAVKVPCMALIVDAVKSSYVTVGVVAIVFAFLEIIGMLFAACLIRSIKQQREANEPVANA